MSQKIKTYTARKIMDDFKNDSDIYYITLGGNVPWDVETSPPSFRYNVLNTDYLSYDNLICGKKIDANQDVMMGTKRYNWVANTVYSQYSDIDENLYDKNFYVVVDANTSFQIFKCLENNNNSPSTIKPLLNLTDDTEPFFITNDGYKWKYMTSIDNNIMDKFSTNDILPLTNNTNVSSSAISGAIDSILVLNGGSGYNAYANGYFREISVGGDDSIFTIDEKSSANTDFYKGSIFRVIEGVGAGQQSIISEYVVSGGFKRVVLANKFDILPNLNSKYEISPYVKIVGDGYDAQAVCSIDSNTSSITKINITNRGYGYTWANVEIISNTGIISQNNILSNVASANIHLNLSPSKGHGYDIFEELGADKVILSTTFDNTENETISNSLVFRNYGLLKNPLFNNVILNVSNVIGQFITGENILINNSIIGTVDTFNNSLSKLYLKDVTPNISYGNLLVGATSNASGHVVNIDVSNQNKNFETFEQRQKFSIIMDTVGEFSVGDVITQPETGSTAIVSEANTTFVAVTNVRGTFNKSDDSSNTVFHIVNNNFKSAKIIDFILPDLKKTSGTVINISNVLPIQRAENSKEKINLIMSF